MPGFKIVTLRRRRLKAHQATPENLHFELKRKLSDFQLEFFCAIETEAFTHMTNSPNNCLFSKPLHCTTSVINHSYSTAWTNPDLLIIGKERCYCLRLKMSSRKKCSLHVKSRKSHFLI
eukprot:4979032-Amphidinium_carterae.1